MIQLHDVDLKLLRVFATIVRCGGFSAAQAALNAGLSWISKPSNTSDWPMYASAVAHFFAAGLRP